MLHRSGKERTAKGAGRSPLFRWLTAVCAAAVLLSAFAVSAAAVELPGAFRQGRTRMIELGDSVTFVLQEDGSLWGWGGGNGDEYFKLGTGGSYEYVEDLGIYGQYYTQDTPVKLMDGVAEVRTGTPYSAMFTTVVKEDGSLWYTGQDTNTFRKLDDGVVSACCAVRWNYDDVFTGYYDIYAVKENNELWRYPFFVTYGPVMGGPKESMVWQAPEKIMDGVSRISAGYSHFLVLKTDGSVWAWGDSSRGQLGNGESGTLTGLEPPEIRWVEEPVKVMDGAADILASWNFSAAIGTDGTLWVWGETYYDGSDLGGDYMGTGLEYSVRTKPTKLADQVAQVHHNQSYTTIVKQDGSIWVWGSNVSGLADGSDVHVEAPVDTGISGAKWAAGSNESWMDGIFYVKEDGSLWMQGRANSQGGEFLTAQITGKQEAAPVPAFADVPAGAYYADAVTWAVEKEITSGTSATTFSPDATCTRAQILTFLWRANGSPAPAIENPFSDVPADAYYAHAAAWACEKGLVSGGTFGGDAPATRADTVTYLWKLAGRPAPQGANPFTDVTGDTQAVVWAMEQGITAGTSVTTFSPGNTCTRGQIVTFLYRGMGD